MLQVRLQYFIASTFISFWVAGPQLEEAASAGWRDACPGGIKASSRLVSRCLLCCLRARAHKHRRLLRLFETAILHGSNGAEMRWRTGGTACAKRRVAKKTPRTIFALRRSTRKRTFLSEENVFPICRRPRISSSVRTGSEPSSEDASSMSAQWTTAVQSAGSWAVFDDVAQTCGCHDAKLPHAITPSTASARQERSL